VTGDNISAHHQTMLEELRRLGQNWGFAKLGTAAIAVGPGAPFSVTATDFYATDIDSAVEAGALVPSAVSGSYSFERFIPAS
jgi:hypothetical protein